MLNFMKKLSIYSSVAVILVVTLILSCIPTFALVAGDKVASSTDTTDLAGNGYTVVYEGDMSEKEYAFSPSICVVENGTYKGRIIVSWDVNSTTVNVPAGASIGNIGHAAYSTDGGATFTAATLASDNFLFATVFEAGDAVYLMARESTTRHLIIAKSTDGGATYGDFVTIEDTRTWHTAPSGVYKRGGKVYILWENGATGRASLSPVLWWAEETADLSVAENWAHSGLDFSYGNRVGNTSGNNYSGTYINTDYLGAPFYGDIQSNLGWLEGSVTEIMDENSYLFDSTGNTLYCYLRATKVTSGYANLMKFVYNGTTWVPSLVTAESGADMLYTQLPGGHNKFQISVDTQTGVQWMVASVSTDSMDAAAASDRQGDPINERKDLGLYYSKDGINWNFAGFVARGDSELESRNYASMYIYGNDMYILSRSGDENAATAHNNNLITLHKVENFRALTNQENVGVAGVVLDSTFVNGSDVENVNTFADAAGNNWVTCNVGDSGYVLLKNQDGTFTQTLKSDYKLGEVVEIGGTLYVFGTDATQLVAYTYVAESGWGTETVIKTGKFAGAPSDVKVESGNVYIAVDQIDEPEPVVYNWSNWQGTTTIENISGGVKVNADIGTGAASYGECVTIPTGKTVATDVTFNLSGNTANVAAGIAFASKQNMFYGWNDTTGYGIGIQFSNANTIQYFTIANGTKAFANFTEKPGFNKAANGLTYQVRLTDTTAEGYWTLEVQLNAAVYSTQISVDKIPANAFADGTYLNAGNRVKLSSGANFTATNPKVLQAGWTIYQGTITTTAVDGGVKISSAAGTGAASWGEKTALTAGNAVSTDITFNLAGNTKTVAAGVAFTSAQNMYYGWGATTGYGIGVQFNNANKIQYFTIANNTKAFANFTGTPGFNIAADGLTYQVRLTDTTAEGYWTLEVQLNATVYTAQIPVDKIPANAFANGVYLNAGNRVQLSADTTFSVTNTTAIDNTPKTATISDYCPTVYKAATASFAPGTTAFSELKGVTFANKIGNPAEANLGLFGLPEQVEDASAVGWSNAKFVRLNGSDANDLRFRNYAATNDAVGVGSDIDEYESAENHSGLLIYMPIQNLGSNYAAMFMVDDALKAYAAPSGEEMILVHLPGGNYSFDIAYDSATATYWLATTEDTDDGNARLALYYSSNAYDWIYFGALATGLTGDANASIAIADGNIYVTAGITELKQYVVEDFAEKTYDALNSLSEWVNIRGYSAETLTTNSKGTAFNSTAGGGARLANTVDVREGTAIAITLGTSAVNWTAGGKFTIGLLNAQSFVGGSTDTGSGFILDVINNNGVSANAYLYTVTAGKASGSGAVAANKLNTMTFTENQVTGEGIQFVFTRRTHKDENGNDCTWILSVVQSNGTVLQKSLTAEQVPADLFQSGATVIAGCRYGTTCKYTVKEITTYTLYAGDINGDFTADAKDTVTLRKGLLRDDKNTVFDINGDDAIDIRDLVRLKKIIAG